MSTPADFIVAGGGIAGLVLARDLALGGAQVRLIEAASRLGGQVSAHDVNGTPLDAAAESFATRDPSVATLLSELNIAGRVVTPRPNPAWLIRDDGSASPLPSTGLLGVPSDLLAPEVADAIGEEGVARALLDRTLSPRIGADATSFGALVRARMGDAVVDRLVAPITRGVHSKEPEALSVEAAHPSLRRALAETGSLAEAVLTVRALAPAGSPVASLRGGMHTLVSALEASLRELGVDISLATRGTALTPTSLRADGQVQSGHIVRAHPVPGAITRPIQLVTLVVTGDLADAPRGGGALVSAGAPLIAARALTHVTGKWAWASDAFPSHHVVRLSYDPDVVDPVSHALDDAQRIFDRPLQLEHPPILGTWRRSGITPYNGAIPTVGETVAGTGLAAIIPHARTTASALLHTSQLAREHAEELTV